MSLLRPVSREERRRRRHERRLKRIAMLPAMFTLGNLLCGFAAICCCVLSVQADGGDLVKLTMGSPHLERVMPTFLSIGGFLIFFGMVCDGLDGRLARLTRRTSDFGGQLDSLADVITFGAAPAMLVICLIVNSHLADNWPSGVPILVRRAAWVAVALYAACAALRLARFNVENVHDEAAHFWFKGLPSPGAAATVSSLIILHEHIQQSFPTTAKGIGIALPPIALVLGLLMVSRVRYSHAVNHFFRRRRPLWHLVLLLVVFMTGMLKFEWFIAIASSIYAISGPIGYLAHRWFGLPAPAQSAGGQTAPVTGEPLKHPQQVG
jgi:CDP-diacylglycerol--serine O-phosphatidyltransferase